MPLHDHTDAAHLDRVAADPADASLTPPSPTRQAPGEAIGEEPHADDMYGRAMRHDGWTPPRQRRFLEFIADGHIVDHAARMVGLSATSAYAFRRRPAGAAFALGWRAANLVARDHLADTMLERARNGTTETITRDDGSTVERHRVSDRLGLQLLARLDRQADAASAADATAAQLVAGDFDPFLDLVGDDAGAARAGLFLAARSDADAALADLAALARADRIRRAAPPGDVADLDPAARHGWTAEQWCRAEAAGIVGLAPEPAPEAEPAPPATSSQLPQLDPAAATLPTFLEPVWWSEEAGEYRTHFPPPDDFDGVEDGVWDQDDYERPLSPSELSQIGEGDDDAEARLEQAYAERTAWFAAQAPQAPPVFADPVAAEPGTPPPPAR